MKTLLRKILLTGIFVGGTIIGTYFLPSEKITTVNIDNERIATLEEPVFGKPRIFVYNSNRNLKEIFTISSDYVFYFDYPNLKSYRILDSGYFDLGETNSDVLENSEFIKFSDDSVSKKIESKKEDFENIYQEIEQEKELRKKLKRKIN